MLGIFEMAGEGGAVTGVINRIGAGELKCKRLWREMVG